ncbi:hypothetical protein E4U33_004041 [Claviceps sp. LM78 group G4]|nr:hypothetical protein E4U33_004041 [Claviceps sp. LM78 group G4]
MAYQGHPVRGAEVGESVNRGGCDLHSSHQNTENQDEIASLLHSMVQVVENPRAERGRAEERDRRIPETSQQSAIPDLKEGIEGAIAKALSKTPSLPRQHRRGLPSQRVYSTQNHTTKQCTTSLGTSPPFARPSARCGRCSASKHAG